VSSFMVSSNLQSLVYTDASMQIRHHSRETPAPSPLSY